MVATIPISSKTKKIKTLLNQFMLSGLSLTLEIQACMPETASGCIPCVPQYYLNVQKYILYNDSIRLGIPIQ